MSPVFASLAKSSSQIVTFSSNDVIVRSGGVPNSNFFPAGGVLSPCILVSPGVTLYMMLNQIEFRNGFSFPQLPP